MAETDLPKSHPERSKAAWTLLVRGATEDDVRFIAVSKWNANPSEAQAALDEAAARFKSLATWDAMTEKGKQIARVLDVYSRSYRNADYQRALKALEVLAAAMGLGAHAPKPRTDATAALDREIEALEKELKVT